MNDGQREAPRLFGDHFLNELNAQERAAVGHMRQLCREQFGPQAQAVAQADVFAWETFRTLVREGIIATAFPTRYGGTEARQLLRIRLIEEAGRVCSATASLITGTDLSSRAIIAGGSEELKECIVPGLCDGTLQSAFGLTEAAAGSDVRRLQTTFEHEGDAYVINGEKKFISRASTADWIVIVGHSASEPGSLVAAVVPKESEGLEVSAEVPKLGWWGVPISSLRLHNVRVPVAYRLGAEGEGFRLAQDALLRARIGHAAMALGRAIGAVEIAAAYAVDRHSFGKALGAHEGIQWLFVDMVTQIESSRAFLALVANKYDRGDSDVAVYASMIKLQATDLCMRVVTDALQLTGGRGYLKAFPLERFFRDAKLNQIGEGASEVHKMIIGRDVIRRVEICERNPCLHPESLVAY